MFPIDGVVDIPRIMRSVPSTTVSLAPGVRLGACEVRSLLGAGGMGEVLSRPRHQVYVQIHSEKAPEGNLWGWLLP